MDSLRDITQQCGQPTALSQLATNLTATNPSVLADASIYKQAPQITNNGPNAMGMQHVPTASNLMHQFNSSKPMHAVPMPLHAPQQIHTHKQEEQITAQMKQMQIQQPQQYQHMPQPMMMQMPQQMMMQPQPMMNMQYQMPPQVYQQPPVQQMQKQEPQIQKDEVNTNGTTDSLSSPIIHRSVLLCLDICYGSNMSVLWSSKQQVAFYGSLYRSLIFMEISGK
eukprot:600069_1